MVLRSLGVSTKLSYLNLKLTSDLNNFSSDVANLFVFVGILFISEKNLQERNILLLLVFIYQYLQETNLNIH